MMMQQPKETVALVQPPNNYVYILRCHDKTYYTGWTTNLLRRLKKHNAGTGAKYTRCRRPVELVYFETLNSRSEALKREYQIKQLTRKQKELLISSQSNNIIEK